MTKKRVLVIGSTGMLGEAVYKTLSESRIEVLEASRSRGFLFDAEKESPAALFETLGLRPGDYIVNCVGLTKTYINANDIESVERAVRLNVMFPIAIARAAEALNLKVIQVATDCVFSGASGNYLETSPHDAHDIYGKTKSIGEVISEQVMHLRCSLIGPESMGRQSLFFEWVRAAESESNLKGYVNHWWNGLTSFAFSKIVRGIIEGHNFKPGVQHLVPADATTKCDLIRLELEFLQRRDVLLEDIEAEKSVDRTLATCSADSNKDLFTSGGYEQVPTIREMMEELPWEALRERSF